VTVTAVAVMAQTYAHAGWKVFPLWWVRPWTPPDRRHGEAGTGLICACPAGGSCKSPGKHPLFPLAHRKGDPTAARCAGGCGATGHGVNDATADARVVARWWEVSPLANIGIPAGGNALAILDVDPAHGGDRSFARLRAWMADRDYMWPAGHVGPHTTLVQRTGSGGEHWVFQAPPGGVINKSKAFGRDMPGLDTRGRGGYVVGSPSMHASGQPYSWVDFFVDLAPWPALLSSLIDPPRLVAPIIVESDIPAEFSGVDRYAAAAVVAELNEVRGAPEGQRNDTLNSAAFSIGQFVGAGRLDERLAFRELCAAAHGVGLEQREIEKSVLSGLRGGKSRPRRGRSGGDG
jgi:hypothetical protein